MMLPVRRAEVWNQSIRSDDDAARIDARTPPKRDIVIPRLDPSKNVVAPDGTSRVLYVQYKG